jgi:hypothetical protein
MGAVATETQVPGRCSACLTARVDLEERLALVSSTWTPYQRLHPGNVAWHGTGCDGAPPADLELEGPEWFADAWLSERKPEVPATVEVDAHFSPQLTEPQRQRVYNQIRELAPRGTVAVVSDSAMKTTIRSCGACDVDGPYFLLQHRTLDSLPDAALPDGYRITTAAEAGVLARVQAHRDAWAPARIKSLLGLPITGDEPTSSFSMSKYRAMKEVSIYRPELDLVVLAADGSPAAFALGWLDDASQSLLFEPVGTSPAHALRGLSFSVCAALMHGAVILGAREAIVGPRGDDAYPIPRYLYASLGFTSVGRTCTLAWSNP